MLKNIIKLTFSFLIISISVFSQSQEIDLNIKNAKKGNKIYLFEVIGGNNYKTDSTILNENGKGKLNFNKAKQKGFYQLGTNETNMNIFVLADNKLKIDAEVSDFKNNFIVSGSKEDALFRSFVNVSTKQAQDANLLQTEVQSLTGKMTKTDLNYNITIKKYQDKLDSINKSKTDYYKIVLQQNPNSFIGKVLSMFLFDDQTTKDKIFADNEYKDDELARGDMLNNKISFFISKYWENNPESWMKESEILINKMAPKSLCREVTIQTIIATYAAAGMDIPENLISTLTTQYPNKRTKDFVNKLPKREPKEGDLATDIVLDGIDGKKISLSSLRGKVVLIDFWSSWCGPCRIENPNVVKAYQKYKDKGFTVFSVSLDSSKEKWMQAIEKDGLEWKNHVSDLKGWQSEGAKLYSVRGIPATFLIDKSGRIIAKNLRGKSLEDKLEELLK